MKRVCIFAVIVCASAAPAVAQVSRPAMSLDGPANNSTVVQPFITGGWAVDLASTAGAGVDAIHVWAFPVSNTGVIGAGVFVDAALLHGNRPDVGAVFGHQFDDAGFNFVMAGLAPGHYYIGVYVHSTVSGAFDGGHFALTTVATSPGGFGAGQYLVGSSAGRLPPQRYLAKTASVPSSCYWERQRGFSGTLDDIISNDFSFGYLQSIVDVAPTDLAFMTESGCGIWSNYMKFGVQAGIQEGQWLVGAQLVPGTYVANPAKSGCYWERDSSFSGLLSAILANDFRSTAGQVFVTIKSTDVGFTTSGCGSWSRVSALRADQVASTDDGAMTPETIAAMRDQHQAVMRAQQMQ